MLAKKENRDHMIRKTQRSVRAKKLFSQWDEHAEFSNHNHRGLIETVKNLNTLIRHYKRVKWLPLLHYLVPTPIYLNFLRFCDKFVSDSEVMEFKIACSMLARLRAWDQSCGKYCDPTIHLVREFQEISVLDDKMKLPAEVEQITNYQLLFFVKHILKMEDASLKAELNELSFFQSEHLAKRDYGSRAGQFVMPVDLYVRLPSSLPRLYPWLKRFLPYLWPQIDVIRASQLTFIAMSWIPPLDEIIVSLKYLNLYDRDIEGLETIEKRIKDTKIKFQGCPKSFIQNRYKIFYKTFHASLDEALNRVNEVKLVYTERLFEKCRSQFASPSQAATNAWQACYRLRTAIDNLKSSQIKNDDLLARLIKLELSACQMLAMNRCFSILEEIQNEDIHRPQVLKYLFNLFEQIEKISEKEADSFYKICQPKIQELSEKYQKLLRRNPFNLSEAERNENKQKILTYDAIINRCGDATMKEKINNAMTQYFKWLLQKYNECGSDDKKWKKHNQDVLQMESLLQMVSYKCDSFCKDVGEMIEEMRSLRQKNNFRIHYANARAWSKLLGREDFHQYRGEAILPKTDNLSNVNLPDRKNVPFSNLNRAYRAYKRMHATIREVHIIIKNIDIIEEEEASSERPSL